MSATRKIGSINAGLSSSARSEFLAFLADVGEEPGYLGIDKGRWDGEEHEHWMYGFYTADQVEVAAPEIEELGHALLYDLDGLVVVCPQFHLLHELEGKILNVANGTIYPENPE